MIHSQLLGIFRRIYDRLPTFLRKVFGELYPTLYA
jgi:hypothetical protein